jgi:hypothetical protein
MGFAVYSGGLETGHISALYNVMEALLRKHTTAPYCANIAEYIIGIYTDGNICQYGYIGVSKVRLLAKDRSLSCCMGVPEALWRGKTSEELKVPLADLWLDCFDGFAKRIEKAALTPFPGSSTPGLLYLTTPWSGVPTRLWIFTPSPVVKRTCDESSRISPSTVYARETRVDTFSLGGKKGRMVDDFSASTKRYLVTNYKLKASGLAVLHTV